MQPVDRLSLHPHQQALLAEIVAAYDQDHSEFRVWRSMSETSVLASVEHPAWASGQSQYGDIQYGDIQYGDIVALQRAGMIDAVHTSERGNIVRFAPTALASASVRPGDYLDLSDAAWAVAKNTLHNEPERIRDVQGILDGILDNPDASDDIKETASAARILLGQVERYVDSGNPADEPLARSSAAGLRALAATILRRADDYGPLAIELAQKVAGLFGV